MFCLRFHSIANRVVSRAGKFAVVEISSRNSRFASKQLKQFSSLRVAESFNYIETRFESFWYLSSINMTVTYYFFSQHFALRSSANRWQENRWRYQSWASRANPGMDEAREPQSTSAYCNFNRWWSCQSHLCKQQDEGNDAVHLNCGNKQIRHSYQLTRDWTNFSFVGRRRCRNQQCHEKAIKNRDRGWTYEDYWEIERIRWSWWDSCATATSWSYQRTKSETFQSSFLNLWLKILNSF